MMQLLGNKKYVLVINSKVIKLNNYFIMKKPKDFTCVHSILRVCKFFLTSCK